MKTNIGKYMFAVILFSLVSCADVEEVSQLHFGVTSPASTQQVNLTLGMGINRQTRVGLSEKDGSNDMEGRFQDGDVFWICARQGMITEEVGMVPLSNVSPDGKHASLTLNLPTTIDTNSEYSVYGITAEGLDGNRICNGQLYYYSYFSCSLLEDYKVPVSFEGKGTSNHLQVNCNYVGSHILVHLNNNSQKNVNFRFRGFGNDVFSRIMGNLEPESSDYFIARASDNERFTDSFTISKGSEQVVAYGCLPADQAPERVNLLCEVDGQKIVSANQLTIGRQLESGKAYHLNATWDGSRLLFDGKEDVVIVPSDALICIREGYKRTVGLFTMGVKSEDLEATYNHQMLSSCELTKLNDSSASLVIGGGEAGLTDVVVKDRLSGFQTVIKVYVVPAKDEDVIDELGVGISFLSYSYMSQIVGGPIVDIPGFRISDGDYTCESSDSSVVTAGYADFFGKVTFGIHGIGLADITVRDNQTGKKSVVKVAVDGPADWIVNMKMNENAEKAINMPSYYLEAFSEDPSVATAVTREGGGRVVYITAKHAGNTRIHACDIEGNSHYIIYVHIED